MKRMGHCVRVLCLVGYMGGAGEASAQVIAADEWRQGTTLALFGGATSASSTRAALGGAVGWEVLPHLTIDGSGLWEAPQHGSEAFSALLGVRVNVTGPATVVPFVSAGVGLYHATFDSGAVDVPEFYRHRMAAGSLTEQHVFDDFSFSVGGGLDIFLKRHLALRPDVRVMFVWHDSETRTVPVYGVHLAYHFEEHVVTP